MKKRSLSCGDKNFTRWATLFLILVIGLFSFASCDLGGGMGKDALGGSGGTGAVENPGGGAGGGTGTGTGGGTSPNPGWIGSSLLLPGGTVYQTSNAPTFPGIEHWPGMGTLLSAEQPWLENHPLGTIEDGVLTPISRSEIPNVTAWTEQVFFSNSGLTVIPLEGRGFMQYEFSVRDSEDSEMGVLIRVVMDSAWNKVHQVYYWYAEQSARFFGTYTETDGEESYTVSMDVSLEAGWNRIIADITYSEQGVRLDYRTGPEPEGAFWLFFPNFEAPGE